MHKDYASSLNQYNRFTLPLYRAALHVHPLPQNRRGLDAGCGTGGLFALLGDYAGDDSQITGLDLSLPHLRASKHPVPLVCADLSQPLPFADNTFDWIWCADTLWPHTIANTDAVLSEFVRITAPGGWVILFFDQPFRGILLPGYLHLEVLLRRAMQMIIPPDPPAGSIDQIAQWLRRAGLTDIRFTSHSHHYQPVDKDTRHYLQHSVIGWYRSIPQSKLLAAGMTPQEKSLWQSLSDPKSPAYILNQPAYYYVRLGLCASGRVK